MSRSKLIVAVSLAVIAAAGCSAAPQSSPPSGTAGPATAAPAAEPTAAAPTGVAPSAAPATSGAATPPTAGSPTEDPSTPHMFPELEARIPDSVGGLAIRKASFGADFSEGALSADFQAAVEQFGLTSADVQLATAGPDFESDRELSIVLFKIGGADGAQFLQALRTITEANPDTTGTITDATIAGRSVLALTQGENTQYAYAAGDGFFIVGGEPALVEATISLLP